MKATGSSLKYFLVQHLSISNREAISYIIDRKVLVNDAPARVNQEIEPHDKITFEGKTIKQPKEYIYIAYYKPRGIECTLNAEIEGNMLEAMNIPFDVYPIGRLDKESEGLILLTNDGGLYNAIAHSTVHQEKEYVVETDKPVTDEMIVQMATGIIVMGQKTRPAIVNKIGVNSFNIILTQGLNRQIRRMCHKLGLEVKFLKRVRIVNITIGNLKSGEWRQIVNQELIQLKEQVFIKKD